MADIKTSYPLIFLTFFQVSLAEFLAPSILVIEVLGGFVTLIVTEAFFLLPSFAVTVILAFPIPTAVTTPLEFTLAAFVLDDFHVTFLFAAVTGLILTLSVAFCPITTFLLEAFTLNLETFTALLITLNLTLAFTPSVVLAVIVTVPSFTAFTFPLLETVAIFCLKQTR